MKNTEIQMNSIRRFEIMKKLGLIFNEIFTKKLTSENLKFLLEIKEQIIEIRIKYKENTLHEDYQQLMDDLIQRLNFYLVESMHIQISCIIRELLRDIYGIEYTLPDSLLIDSALKKDHPKIFADKIYTENSFSLLELINNPGEKQLKDTSEFFTSYQPTYPYSSKVAMDILEHLSNTSGRLKFFEGFFLWFYEYFNLYEKSLNILMSENEHSIPVTWRYYIAIMAVSTIRCEYLLKELELQFLIKGGDESWLINGLSNIPTKLKKLEKINNILAHQPWKLKVQDLTEIYSKYESNGWHINELVHSVLILVNYHRLATLVESFKLNLIDTTQLNDPKIEQKEPIISSNLGDDNVKKIIISELENINNSEKSKISKKRNLHSRKRSEEILISNSSFEKKTQVNSKDFTKHISSYCTVYLDFDSHSEEFLSHIEYNWQDQGSYILKNFYPSGVEVINAEINYLTSLSSNNIGGGTKKVDTTQYRHTISTYVEKIFGIVDESFDYSNTNKLLHRTHKQFIKNIACFPHRIDKIDVGVLKVTFTPEDIFHIILFVSTVKMRLQLTYFSKELYEIIKSID